MKNNNSPLIKEPYSSPETGILEWDNLRCYLQNTSPGNFNDEDDYGGGWN